jgi:hypothetical protein
MSNFLVAVFFGAGVGAWAYAQLAKRNGGANPANNAMAAGLAGFVAAIVIFTVFKFILNIS